MPEKYAYLVNFCKGFTCSDDYSSGGGKDTVVSCCFVVVVFVCVCVCANTCVSVYICA